MFLYKRGRLQLRQVSVEMPDNVLISEDITTDQFVFSSPDSFWHISIEETLSKEAEGIWGDWLEDTDVYEKPAGIVRAGFAGEYAVWGGARDLYYELRFPLSREDGHLAMLRLTLCIPHFTASDIRKIKDHPTFNQILNSMRLEE